MPSNFLFAQILLFCLFQGFQIPSTPPTPQNDSESHAPQLILIDASAEGEAAKPLNLPMSGRSANGRTIQVTSRYLLLDGKPWLPVMGEFQYSRYPQKYWEEELLKMKAAGIGIISTYVFWIHHEEVEGQFDWTGQRDLRRFAELCRKQGLFLVVRIGPYVHGEARNGGLPDWIIQEGNIRQNNSKYLAHVRKLYEEIGRQLQGHFWQDDGPVIGVQLENEYVQHGPDAGAAHIAKLKKIAIEAGLTVPLYTVTGWGNAEFPSREVVPVFGIYPDAFWESVLQKLPASEGYLFSLRRDLGGIAGAAAGSAISSELGLAGYPYFLAEAGGGMQVAYHRRPLITADDVSALAITHLGSGANLYGYYLFQGGANPIGRRSTMQEAAATDHVYDLPVISYDFQAPLGQYGQVRPWYRALKPLHLFIQDFGSDLAEMSPVLPQVVPSGGGDRLTPRVAARVNRDSGFLFFNNYLRDYPMQDQKQLQVRIKLSTQTTTLPRAPVDIPSGAHFIWPLNLRMNGAVLNYATAQLICNLEFGGDAYYFFQEVNGVPAEFAIDEESVSEVEVASGKPVHYDGKIYLSRAKPSTRPLATVWAKNGGRIHIVLLTEAQAQNISKVTLAGRERIIWSDADVFFSGNEITMRARNRHNLWLSVFPPLAKSQLEGNHLGASSSDGIFVRYVALTKPVSVSLKWQETRLAAPSRPVTKGEYNAISPVDSDFDGAAVWRLDLPANIPKGCDDIFLQIRYAGDIARIYEARTLLDDNYYDGEVWEIGLKRFLDTGSAKALDLKVIPLRKDAPIFLPPAAWSHFESKKEVADVSGVQVVPEYEVRISVRE